MQIQIQRRAEIALRSLPPVEQKRLHRALYDLESMDRAGLGRSHKLKRLPLRAHDRQLFVYISTGRLRLILSLSDEVCIVEDVVDHDQFERMVAKQGQE